MSKENQCKTKIKNSHEMVNQFKLEKDDNDNDANES